MQGGSLWLFHTGHYITQSLAELADFGGISQPSNVYGVSRFLKYNPPPEASSFLPIKNTCMLSRACICMGGGLREIAVIRCMATLSVDCTWKLSVLLSYLENYNCKTICI